MIYLNKENKVTLMDTLKNRNNPNQITRESDSPPRKNDEKTNGNDNYHIDNDEQITIIDNVEIQKENDDEILLTSIKSTVNDLGFTLPPLEDTKEALYSDEELEEAIKEFVKSNNKPPKNMIEPLMVHIQKELILSIFNEDYDRAEMLKKAKNSLTSILRSENTENPKNALMSSIKDRIKEAKDRIERANVEWKERMGEFDEQIKKKHTELLVNHEEERKLLESRVMSKEFMIEFNKPSTTLLQMRKLQHQHAVARDFVGAKEMKKKADDLEKSESKDAQDRAMRKATVLFANLQEKQRNEVSCSQANWKRKRIELEQKRDLELNSLKTQLKLLERKEKETSQSTFHSKSSLMPNPSNTQSFAALTKPTTPRTRKNFAKYRMEPHHNNIQIQTIDINRIPLSPHRKKNDM